MIAALVVFAMLFAAWPVRPAHAAGLVVNTNADNTTAGDGFCTLREAIDNANTDTDNTSGDCDPGSGSDTITFADGYTIVLGADLPLVVSVITIDGEDKGVVVSGDDSYQVFSVSDLGDLTVNALSIRNGFGVNGGGVFSEGTVTIMNSAVYNHSGDAGIGGVFNFGFLTIANSTLSNNSGDNVGGVANFGGTASILNSTLAGNSGSLGAVYTAAGCFTAAAQVLMADGSMKSIAEVAVGDEVLSYDFESGQQVASRVSEVLSRAARSYLRINDLEVTAEHPFAVGGGEWRRAGALELGDRILSDEGWTTVISISQVEEEVEVYNITVDGTHNYYVSDGEETYLVHNKALQSTAGEVTLINTIITGTTIGADCFNDGGSFVGNDNLIDDHALGDCAAISDEAVTGLDGTLANNGGPTPTFALLSTSNAIDTGDDATCADSPVDGRDQRGVARPQGTACDIGAFEADGEEPTVTVEQAAGQADPTGSSPINFTVTFSESVTGFGTGDVTLVGTAGATLAAVSETAPNDGATFNVAVSGMATGGTVVASVEAGAATDISGNPNQASTSIDNEVTYDPVSPLIAALSLLSSYTEPGPSFFTVTFNKEMNNPPGNNDEDDVNNPDNYLLVEAGANAVFDTVSCVGGLAADDTQVAVTSVSYDNSTLTSTVTLANPLPAGSYRLFLCGTTSLVDIAGNAIGGGTDFIFDFVVNPAGGATGGGATGDLPLTGFPPGYISPLPAQAAESSYISTDLRLEIPTLDVNLGIVGVPEGQDGWDVTWLGNNVGWLGGSAFPTLAGNSVLTAHVWDAFNQPGAFADLKKLKYGDEILIHAWGQVYTYQVRGNVLVTPGNVDAVFRHEEYDWLTLLTCEGYNQTSGDYTFRRMVRAVLVSVDKERD